VAAADGADLDGALTLTRGHRTIEIRAIGRGHTAGDLVVWLPQEKIVAAGDLVIAPIPLVGGDQSYVGDWPTTLDHLLALGATTIVPGHGPVMHDTAFITQWQKLLRELKTQTDAAMARGETQEQAIGSIHVDDFRTAMAGASSVLNMLFRNYVTPPAVIALYRERAGK
jgi:glyoxylase-like metal-dependent hydrolase (beta-lactamase superfamily II)